MLQRHAAARAVLAANLQISRPVREFEHKDSPTTLFWDEECAKKEPVKSLVRSNSSDLWIFERIKQDFIVPWEQDDLGRKRYVSMLLYGPPGTGKTTIAKDIATALKWPLIELSPSDFIAEGSSQVEARSRDIFDALRQQDRVVIFFDEIDRLILDRTSSRYEEQGDFFQFMIPSMLTKFQTLHDVGRVIFI